MKPSIITKLDTLVERHAELGMLLSSPEVINVQNKFRALSKELSDLEPIVAAYTKYTDSLEELESLLEMQQDDDIEIKLEADKELKIVKQRLTELEDNLNI